MVLRESNDLHGLALYSLFSLHLLFILGLEMESAPALELRGCGVAPEWELETPTWGWGICQRRAERLVIRKVDFVEDHSILS